MTKALDFRFDLPFQTRCGWPARLLGVVKHYKYPNVVAVFNPALGTEQVVHYNELGEPKDPLNDNELPLVESILALKNVDDETYYGVTRETRVHAHVKELKSFPPNCNAMHHDRWSMGTPLVRGWIALHEGYGRPDFPDPLRSVTLVNEVSGQVFKVNFTPVHNIEKMMEVKVSTGDEVINLATGGLDHEQQA